MEVLDRVVDMGLMGAISRRGGCQARWRGNSQVRYMFCSFHGSTPLVEDLIQSSTIE